MANIGKKYNLDWKSEKSRRTFEDSQKYIDLEPTWKGLVPSFIRLIERGDAEGKRVAKDYMMQMAGIADWVRQAQKKGVKMLRVPAEPIGEEYKIEMSIGELAQRGAWAMDDVKIDIFKMSSILQGLTGIDKEIWANKMAEMRHEKLKKVM